MDALTENARKPGPVIRRKKKEPPKPPPVSTTTAAGASGASATSPPAVAPLKPEFYRETLIGGTQRKSEESPPIYSPKPGIGSVPVDGTKPQAPPVGGQKKRVRFVDFEKVKELVEIRYFEVDDAERGKWTNVLPSNGKTT